MMLIDLTSQLAPIMMGFPIVLVIALLGIAACVDDREVPALSGPVDLVRGALRSWQAGSAGREWQSADQSPAIFRGPRRGHAAVLPEYDLLQIVAGAKRSR